MEEKQLLPKPKLDSIVLLSLRGEENRVLIDAQNKPVMRKSGDSGARTI